MVNMLDWKLSSMVGGWMVRHVTNLNWNAPTELGLGGPLPWDQSPGPWSSSCRWACQYTYHPKWGIRRATLPLWRNPLPHTTLHLLLQGDQWLFAACIPPAGFSQSQQTWAEGKKICVQAAASSLLGVNY